MCSLAGIYLMIFYFRLVFTGLCYRLDWVCVFIQEAVSVLVYDNITRFGAWRCVRGTYSVAGACGGSVSDPGVGRGEGGIGIHICVLSNSPS